MNWVVCVVLSVALVKTSQAASLKLPSYIKACSRSDPKMNECARASAQAALPSLVKGDAALHIPVLEPLHLEKVQIDEGTGGAKFSLTLNNVSLIGLSHAEILLMSFDLAKKLAHGKLIVRGTELKVISKYVIDGKILVLPIKGSGNMNLTTENLQADIKLNYDLVNHEDGLEYMKVKDSSVDLEVTRAYFHFENLFNGDKALGDNVNVFLNENWQDVFNEVKPALSEVVKTIVSDIISKVTDKVAYDKIFIP